MRELFRGIVGNGRGPIGILASSVLRCVLRVMSQCAESEEHRGGSAAGCGGFWRRSKRSQGGTWMSMVLGFRRVTEVECGEMRLVGETPKLMETVRRIDH